MLSDGGFLAIHKGIASSDIIGTSGYLEAGTYSNVRVDLDTPVNETITLVAIPHLEDNSNNLFDFPEADAPYSVHGTAVTGSAEVTVGDATPMPTTTTGDGAGFGIAVSLIALLAAALLTARRRE